VTNDAAELEGPFAAMSCQGLCRAKKLVLDVPCRAMYRTSLFPVLDFLCTQIVSAERDAPSFDLFLVECMRFVAEALESKAYKGRYEALGVGPAARAQVLTQIASCTQQMPVDHATSAVVRDD
jgi:hypothetical protein